MTRTAADWFSRLLEEEVPEQDFKEWQRWLAASPGHQRAYRDVEQAWYLIGTAACSAQGPAAELQRTEAYAPPDAQLRAGRTLGWAIAATVLLISSGVLLWRIAGPSHPDTYATATAEQRLIRLPDGSRVTLGAQSKLSLLFGHDYRRVVLERGEAYFEVDRDPRRPFMVAAGASEIRVIGTAFNVSAPRSRVLVTVTEGRVAVVLPATSSARRGEIQLAAGERAAISGQGLLEEKGQATTGAASWMEGRFEYRGEELRHVVEDLNRYTERRIVLAKEHLGSLRYSGTVFPGHLDEWLEGIAGVLPVTVRDTGRQLEISSVP